MRVGRRGARAALWPRRVGAENPCQARSGALSRLAPGLVSLLSRQVYGQWLALRLLEAGIVAQPAALAWNVLRIEPPLTIQEPELDQIADAVIGILGEVDSVPRLLAEVTARLGEQALRGGAFR